MNANSIRVKGYPDGLIITYESNLSFEDICTLTKDKFSSSRKFFGKNNLCIIFEGYACSEEEEDILCNIIEENSDITVALVYHENGQKASLFNDCIRLFNEEKEKNDIYFCDKSLINEDFIKTTKDCVIIGDVNPGATIISKKNVYVFGGIYGTVIAGFDNDDETNLIMSLDMKPLRMVINDAEYEDYNKHKWGIRPKYNPLVAYSKDGNIAFEEYSKDLLDRLRG